MACSGHPPLTPRPPLSMAAEILGGAKQQQAMPSPRGGCVSPSHSITHCPPVRNLWHASGNYFSHKWLKSVLLLTWPVTSPSVHTVKGLFPQPSYPSSLPEPPSLSPGAPWGPAAGQPPRLGLRVAFPGPSKHLACSRAGMPRSSEQSWPGLSTGKQRWPDLQVAFWVRSCARPSKNRSSILICSLFLHGFHKALVTSMYHVHLSSSPRPSHCQTDSPKQQHGLSLLEMLLRELPGWDHGLDPLLVQSLLRVQSASPGQSAWALCPDAV